MSTTASRWAWLIAPLLAAVLLFASVLPARAVEIQRIVSPMGIEAWLVEVDEVPVISMSFGFRGGTTQDEPGHEGTAFLTSYLLDEGAGDRDSQTFQGLLADAAVELRFRAGYDTFTGSMRTTVGNADLAFELLADALNQPRFDQDAIDRMRAALTSEIRRRVANPGWLSTRAYYDLALGDHPYSRSSRGTPATLPTIDRAVLQSFVDRTFAKDNLVIGVAGSIDAETLGQVLDHVFGGLPDQSTLREVPELSLAGAGQTILVEREGPQSTLTMTQHGIERSDPDIYAASVMNYILGGGSFGSRLTDEVRVNRGLTYGISTGLSHLRQADFYGVDSDLSNENVAEAIEVIRQQWRSMAEDGPTQMEVDDAITYLTGSFPLQFSSTENVARILLAMQLYDLGFDYLDLYTNRISSVTREDVARVAGELLDEPALTTVVVGSPDVEALAPDTIIPYDSLVNRELAIN
ncbi:MAG: pitrilysin family protein [Pseudomonadota bacterium]